jgi:hypothetical protein
MKVTFLQLGTLDSGLGTRDPGLGTRDSYLGASTGIPISGQIQ